MKNKDTDMLSEAYEQQINSGRPIGMPDGGKKAYVEYKDETSKYPQYVEIIADENGTVTLKFDNNFTMSRISKFDAKKFAGAILDTVS